MRVFTLPADNLTLKSNVSLPNYYFFLISIIIFLAASCYQLFFVGIADVYQVSEAREGVVVRELLSDGSKILPLRNGHIVPSKPILFHWLSWGLAEALGRYDQFVLRMPSVLAGAATLSVVFLTVAKLFGLSVGLLAAMILSSMYGHIRLSTDGRVDMLFSFFVIAILCLWIYGAQLAKQQGKLVSEQSSRQYFFLALFAALAVLTKGPLGIVFPGLIIFCSILYEHKTLRALKHFCSPMWLIALIIPAIWYYLAVLEGYNDFIGRQIFFENIQRFLGGEKITSQPVWFYLKHFWSQAAPWSAVIFLFLIAFVFSYKQQFRRLVFNQCFTQDISRFVLIWLIVGLLLFTLAEGKRRAYLLPLLPAVAIYCTLVLSNWFHVLATFGPQSYIAHKLSWKKLRYVILILELSLLLVFFILINSALVMQIPDNLNQEATNVLNGLRYYVSQYPFEFIILPIALALVGLWTLFRNWRFFNPRQSMLSIFIFLLVFVGPGLTLMQAIKGYTHSYREFALHVSEVLRDNQLSIVKELKDESFDGFFFYFAQHVPYIDPDTLPQHAGYYLARRAWLEERPRNFQVRIKELMEGGRRTDKRGERLVLFYFEPQTYNPEPPRNLPSISQAI